jgi:predicted DNA-binding transcriptional regulator AlpA
MGCTITDDALSAGGRVNLAPATADSGDGGGASDAEPASRRTPRAKPPLGFAPALLGFDALSQYLTFGRSRIYGLIAAGTFPRPIKVGKSSRWIRTEIDAWLAEHMSTRGAA